jgi:hypothetical protein
VITLYHIVAERIDPRTGKPTGRPPERVTSEPVTHADGCEIMRRFTVYPWRRLMLVDAATPPADPRAFDVGDALIFTSPATGDALPVTFRGNLHEGGAVVMLNGFQVTVDRSNLSRPVSA